MVWNQDYQTLWYLVQPRTYAVIMFVLSTPLRRSINLYSMHNETVGCKCLWAISTLSISQFVGRVDIGPIEEKGVPLIFHRVKFSSFSLRRSAMNKHTYLKQCLSFDVL